MICCRRHLKELGVELGKKTKVKAQCRRESWRRARVPSPQCRLHTMQHSQRFHRKLPFHHKLQLVVEPESQFDEYG